MTSSLPSMRPERANVKERYDLSKRADYLGSSARPWTQQNG
jgi:hypothetical protein